MITNKEVNLGKTMARLFVLAVIPSFAIQAFVLDPTVSGYNETWGPVLAITNVITGFSLMFVFAITTKLFGDDNNPFVRISGSIAFVTQCVFVMNAFAGPLTSNNEDAYLTTNEVLTAVGGVGPVLSLIHI